jgi:hypothetical protein
VALAIIVSGGRIRIPPSRPIRPRCRASCGAASTRPISVYQVEAVIGFQIAVDHHVNEDPLVEIQQLDDGQRISLAVARVTASSLHEAEELGAAAAEPRRVNR